MSKGNYSYPEVFTYLGLLITELIDKGETISLNRMYEEINNKTVWNLLDEKTEGKTEVYNECQRTGLLNYFSSSLGATENDSYPVNNNGYCLLIAYLFDAIRDKGVGYVPFNEVSTRQDIY